MREYVHFSLEPNTKKLLEYLDAFSNRLLARMQEVQNKVDDLVFETSVAGSNLHNTFNEFIMLSNTQFIENVRLFLQLIF
jgi:hypothetical protein